MLVPSTPELSAQLKAALMKLGDIETADIPSHCVAELLLLDLIEWQAGAGIRFTENGRRVFHQLRSSQKSP